MCKNIWRNCHNHWVYKAYPSPFSSLQKIFSNLLTLFYAGGGDKYPPTTYQQFSPDILIRGGSKYTQNLSFVITEHLTLVSGQKKFPMAWHVGGIQSWILTFRQMILTDKLIFKLLLHFHNTCNTCLVETKV